MRSKNSKPITRAESEHLARVKECSCVTCNAPPPSQAHHVRQGHHFATIAWCDNCHIGALGWHGTKAMQRMRHQDEIDCLNETLRRCYG